MDRDLEGSLMALADNLAHPYNRRKTCCALASSPNDRWLIGCDVGQVVTIDVLPDDVLLTIFDFYVVRYQDLDSDFVAGDVALSYQDTKTKIRSWQAGTRVSTVERPRFCITTPPESATLLYNQNTCKEDPGCLARLASPHPGRCFRDVGG
jgi:hypothetical protein